MSGRRGLTYQPALDGVRAVSLAAVVLFHAGMPWMTGGYLGVSVFFTLSGYLITALLIGEHLHFGRIDLGGFYSRRIRRLAPASIACVAAVMVLSATTDWFSSIGDLRAQVVGAVLQVENWVLLAGKDSYQNLLAQGAGVSSPLAHFWSLAIEEQFYWVWPLTMVGAFWWARRRYRSRRVPRQRTVATVVVLLTVLFAVAAPVTAALWGPDAAYWATPARLSEILIGASAAVLLSERMIPRWWGRVGWLALAVLGVCFVLFPAAGGPAYNGALPVVGVASIALVLGAQTGGGLGTVLSIRPLVLLGRVSYGAYVYHWPTFVVITPERTGWSPIAVFAARIAVTALLTAVSYRFIEAPVRYSRTIKRPGVLSGGLAMTGVVVLLAGYVVPTNAPYWQANTASAAEVSIGPSPSERERSAPTDGRSPDVTSTTSLSNRAPGPSVVVSDGASDNLVNQQRTTDSTPSAPTTTLPTTTLSDLGRPLRVLTAGDSTAGALSTGLIEWAVAHPATMQVEDVHYGGCGVLTGGERYLRRWLEVPEGCDRLIQRDLPEAVERVDPDVVVISVAVWDLMDRRWDGEVYTPFSKVYQDRLLFDYTAVVNRCLDAGAKSVALVLNPPSHTNWNDQDPSDDPARHRVLERIVTEIAADNPSQVSVIDLWQFIDDEGRSRDRVARPDGVHWTPAASLDIAERFLADEVFISAAVRPPDPTTGNPFGPTTSATASTSAPNRPAP